MAKFNLSSVYSKDNIYSVLKLLKALIDTLDNYEFQDPIVDENGDPIPMTWFQKLYKSIHGTADGSVEVGKDAHVDGNINVDLDATIGGLLKLGNNALFAYINYPRGSMPIPSILYYDVENGKILPRSAIGFDPLESLLMSWYDLGETTYANGIYTITIEPAYIDLTSITTNEITRINTDIYNLKKNVSSILPHVNATASTSAENADVYNISFNAKNIPGPFILDVTGDVVFSTIINDNSGSFIYDFDGEDVGIYWTRLDNKNSGTVFDIGFTDVIALSEILGSFQSKLYRHTLNVKGTTYFAIFDYYNTNNEPIDSPQDLTTYLKPTSTSVYPCTCFTNNASTAPAGMNAIKRDNNVWKFCLTGGTTETLGDSVLSVSDSVTAVD